MHSEWFSTPAPAYRELVTRLYGTETGERLDGAYREELGSHERWSHRLEWSGVAVYAGGEVQAHAIVQVIRDKPLVYVGYVEAVNDPAAAGMLVQEIRAALRRQHPGRAVYLPVNQSIWHSYRFKTRGDCRLPFDPPCQPYYGELFARLFETKELYSSYRMPVPRTFRLEGAELPFRIRELAATRLPDELRAIYELSVATFQDAHSFPSFAEFAALYGGAGVTPAQTAGRDVRDGDMTPASSTPAGVAGGNVPADDTAPAAHAAAGMAGVTPAQTAGRDVRDGFNLRYVLIAEAEGSTQTQAAEAGGQAAARSAPVGFIFALPLGEAVYIKTLAVAPAAQNRHAGRLLFESICRRARADGYETVYGLFMKNDRLITQLLPPDAEKVAEYTLYRGG